ncbi:MAG: hypothetical protein QM831_43030 [Kofleriaceae bacterium]
MWAKGLVLIAVAACGGSDDSRHIKDAPGGGSDLGPQVAPGIYLTNAVNSVLAFDLDADGDTPPFRTIAGGTTQLSLPIGVTVDHAGNIYVANRTGSNLTVYGADASGDVAPIRTMTATGMGSPEGMIRGPDDDIIVTTCPSCGQSAGGDTGVWHFARGASTSDFSLTGSATGFGAPSSPAIDNATSTIVIGNSFGGAIETFTSGQQGNVAPTSSFVPAAGYNIQSIALSSQSILVTSSGIGVDFYPRDAANGASPSGSIAAADIGLSYPGGIYFDDTSTPKRIYLADYSANAVFVLDLAGTEPNFTIQAKRKISGPSTMLNQPLDIAVVH